MVFVDASEDSIMVNDVAMPLNPLIVPVEEKEFKETLLDVNLSQWSSKEESFRRVVHIRIDHSA